jgi:hypothetical protein
MPIRLASISRVSQHFSVRSLNEDFLHRLAQAVLGSVLASKVAAIPRADADLAPPPADPKFLR